jgi:hypothetical protein
MENNMTTKEKIVIFKRIQELCIEHFISRKGPGWFAAVNNPPKSEAKDNGYELTRVITQEIFTPELRQIIAEETKQPFALEGEIVDYHSTGKPIKAGGLEFRLDRTAAHNAGVKVNKRANEDSKNKEKETLKHIQITCKFDCDKDGNKSTKGIWSDEEDIPYCWFQVCRSIGGQGSDACRKNGTWYATAGTQEVRLELCPLRIRFYLALDSFA